MRFVEADEDDIGTLTELWYALAKDMEEYSELNELSYADVSEVPPGGFRTQLKSDDITNFLLRESGETIGYVTLRGGRHPSREYSDYLEIVDLFVKERYRNDGYGTEAIEKIKGVAQARGCDHLKVSFEADNESARRFYDETGFEEKRIESVHKLH